MPGFFFPDKVIQKRKRTPFMQGIRVDIKIFPKKQSLKEQSKLETNIPFFIRPNPLGSK